MQRQLTEYRRILILVRSTRFVETMVTLIAAFIICNVRVHRINVSILRNKFHFLLFQYCCNKTFPSSYCVYAFEKKGSKKSETPSIQEIKSIDRLYWMCPRGIEYTIYLVRCLLQISSWSTWVRVTDQTTILAALFRTRATEYPFAAATGWRTSARKHCGAPSDVPRIRVSFLLTHLTKLNFNF